MCSRSGICVAPDSCVGTEREARWNAPNPALLAEMPYEGVMHTSDLFFLFDSKSLLTVSVPI